MKYLIIFILLVTNGILFAQNDCIECEKFKIVGVYDFGPPPRGNWIVLLLTVTEDLDSKFDPHYSDLFFVNHEGDTITKPFGPSLTLPQIKSDTIPYVIELVTDLRNQDFPTDFNGKLIIRTPTGPPCPLITWCNINFSTQTTALTEFQNERSLVKIYPNPFMDEIKIETDDLLENIGIYDQFGHVIYSSDKLIGEEIIHLGHIESKLLVATFKFKNGKIAVRKIMKSN